MTAAVLDASALLALLLGEPGADRVKAVLPDSAMSTVNLAEVVAYFARKGAGDNDIRTMLNQVTFERIPFDADLAHVTGLLHPQAQAVGLSMGDRACLALALRLGVPALTTDRVWQRVAASMGAAVEVIR